MLRFSRKMLATCNARDIYGTQNLIQENDTATIINVEGGVAGGCSLP